MKAIKNFKPVLGMCCSGQRRIGVDDGAMQVYNSVFKDRCDAVPYVVTSE